jgi:hypothetical protein
VATLPASLAGNDVQASVSVTLEKSTINSAAKRAYALASLNRPGFELTPRSWTVDC